ncbi:MAG: DNA-directed RNA polymerase subunit beta' [Patescibacteria group bacterium]|jgi:DNA-directed RNA polymerase subunit beta'
MPEYNNNRPTDFNAMRLKLASPDEIKKWSYGEVIRPETINYRTQKPEKDGLFCEKIFGPSKDWECYCGKYKKIRYKGIVCDKCGVEVTRSIVRRERMGHIELAAPVSHIWFLRGVPSKIGLVLDLSPQALEKVIYFASFIIISVDEGLKKDTIEQINREADNKRKAIRGESTQQIGEIKQRKETAIAKAKDNQEKLKAIDEEFEQELINATVIRDEKLKDLDEAVELAKKELKDLKVMEIISENKYQDLSLKYGHVFSADIGAEAIRSLLEKVDVDQLIEQINKEIDESTKNQKHRLIRRLKLVKNLKKNCIRPEWMILTELPVIPPDLRPMVQLDGGRFAASDLNDLYRRVINRNNRLKRLKELNAPEVIQRNEKRMLQEAVDALIDNGARHGKTVTASTGQKRMLKSLADMLKGKQGRFRQNLLGKRVDYSGRSVIVVGPNLKLHQCGLPKRMALELFKPFVISKLIAREYVYNVRSANRFIESGRSEVWDILEEVTKHAHVLLNRAPTLHRLGIQAFQPVLIEGKAIQIHPLVCTAFNADFDGDQMAVHVPLTEEAKKEAGRIMLASNNLLKPATGEPVVTPSQDIVLGIYYLTSEENDEKVSDRKRYFANKEEAILAFESKAINLREEIYVKLNNEMVKTTCGRVIFNEILPESLRYVNRLISKKELKKIIAECLVKEGRERTVQLLDDVKDEANYYVTFSGMSWGMGDTPVPASKGKVMAASEIKVEEIQSQFDMGLLTEEERRVKIIEVWTKTKDELTEHCRKSLDLKSPTFYMIDSGARGSWGQVTQMMGMKGLVINPAGETIELPVKASFKEGFDVLEYFLSTHGARKGLTDTALRTANAGYLTRRLIDVSQDVVVIEEDCGTNEGLDITKKESDEMGESIFQRILGRVILEDIVDPKTKKAVIKKGELVTEAMVNDIKHLPLTKVVVRSVLKCHTHRGVCQKCYGYDLGYNKPVKLGTAVGIIAAQSIGEPGTQLTMRTFHTGGVAGQDITQGLPRVEELFEARPLKKPGVLAQVDGKVEEIIEKGQQKIINIRYIKNVTETYPLTKKIQVKVKDKDKVKEGDVLLVDNGEEIKSPVDGLVAVSKNELTVNGEKPGLKEHPIPIGFGLWVKEGDLVAKGFRMTEGNLDLRELFALQGMGAVQRYVVKEIQYIYSSQGQKLNDKHIELIVRQMFSRFLVKEPGDSDFVFGEMITRDQMLEANDTIDDKKGKSLTADNILLGLTKASLSTDSFLSAASFQETARVLIDAAVTGKVDYLRGLKENVIIGKLIPVGTGMDNEILKAPLPAEEEPPKKEEPIIEQPAEPVK